MQRLTLPAIPHNLPIYSLSFLSNFSILVIEITGGRLLAPYLGTSATVWASLIAVTLGAMAVGYYFGGKWGGFGVLREKAGIALALSGSFALIAWGMRDYVPTLVSTVNLPVAASALIIGCVLFMPVIIVLASISPLLARMSITRLETSASAVGTLSAVGTVGSIAGAVVTAVLLMPYFGVDTILFGISVLLLVCSLPWNRKSIPRVALFFSLAVITALFFNAQTTRADGWLAEMTTPYNRIVITERAPERKIRSLWTSPFGPQCEMYVDPEEKADEKNLVDAHQKAHDLVVAHMLEDGPRNALFLGGCVATFPRYLANLFPEMKATVVEIDPGMTQAAREYFGFKDAALPNLTFIHEDARLFANKNRSMFDFIYLDAFGSEGRVPFHLMTQEMFKELARSLTDDGIMIVNTHGSYEGPGVLYSASFTETVRAAFPYVGLYQFTNRPLETQNLVIVASGSRQIPEIFTDIRGYGLELRRVETPEHMLRMSDDYAPVDGIPHEMLIQKTD